MPLYTFEEGYFADTYGRNYIKRNPRYKWRSFLKQILTHKKSGKLLDIGCALGLFLREAKDYFDCTGFDISEYALKEANKNVPDKVLLFLGKLGEIRLNETFDVVTCFDVLEHIPNLDLAWHNIKLLLKPDGVLILTVPVYDGPFGWLVNHLDNDQSHIHRRERSFWLDQISSEFEVVSYLGIWRYFLLNQFYINVVSKASRQSTTAIMVIAKKHE